MVYSIKKKKRKQIPKQQFILKQLGPLMESGRQ